MSLYQDLLGPKYRLLPPLVQQMHNVNGEVHAAGMGSVDRGANPLSRLIAAMLGMPKPGTWIPVHITVRREGAGEWLIRDYAGTRLVTHHDRGAGTDAGMLLEGLGPLKLAIALDVEDEALVFKLVSVRALGLPLPRALWPTLKACEAEVDGWYVSYVDIGLPLIGRLIRYCCRIRPEEDRTRP